MKKLSKFLCGALLALPLLGMTAEESRPEVRIPAMLKAPVIDGKIGEAEWSGASVQYGTLRFTTDLLTDRQATYFLGWDKENLYFACRSELPPDGQKLLSRVRKNDVMVTADDTIEFLVYPPHSKKVFHLIVNPRGAYYAAQYDVMDGAVITTEKDFQPKGFRSASGENNGNWEIELVLPFKDVEFTGPVNAEDVWGVQMARSWHNPNDPSSWSKTRLFCYVENMGKVHLDNQALPVTFAGLGPDYGNGNYEVRFRVYNPGKTPRNIRCYTLIKSTAVPRVFNQEQQIAPGKYHDFTLKYIEKAPFTFEFTGEITDTATGNFLYKRSFSFNPPKPVRWESADAKYNNARLEVGYYPYSGVLKARFGSPELRASRDVQAVRFSLNDDQGKRIGDVLDGEACQGGFRKRWQAKDLPEGEYRVHAEVQWKNGKVETHDKSFKVKHFEWEHNQIGCDRIIIPPFQPLKVDAAKREVQALLTGYRAANGFWDAVYAKGENILAAPINLAVNGKADFWREKSFKFTETSPDRVVSVTELTGQGISLSVQNEYDYDGMCKATLTFHPAAGGFAANDVTLVIPVKDTVAQLHHCVTDVPRYHPTGFLPKQQGVLWDSRQGKLHPQVTGNFWPYVWIGEIYKGISWFAANDFNWSLDYTKPALELVRDGQQVKLLVHIVNCPVKWDKEFQIVMGFQPTPVKPQPKNWQVFYDREKPGKQAIPTTILSTYSYGGVRWWNPWPVNNDYTIINRLSRANRRTPGKMLTPEVIEDFFARHKAEIEEATQGNTYGGAEVYHEHLYRGRGHAPVCDFMYPYMNPRSADSRWESFQVFKSEWYYTEYPVAIDYDEYNIEATASYQDMIIWYARKMLREGMDGIYYDNVRLRAVLDPVRGPAYELGDGTIQPFFDFFSFRELLKRTATMIYQEKKFMIEDRPYFIMHMTNGAIMPFLSFGTSQLDLESELGPKEFHDRFSEGYYLTETIGTQAGCIPEIINLVTGNNQKWICRTFCTIQLAFDFPMVVWGKDFDPLVSQTWQKVYGFGYATPECEIIHFWEPGAKPVTCDHPEIRVTVFRRTDRKESLIAVCDLGNSAKTVTLDLQGLGYRHPAAVNEETGESFPTSGNRLTLELPRRDFRLIRIQDK